MKKRVIKNSIRLLLVLIIVIISWRVIFFDVLLIDTVMSNFISVIRCEWLDFFMKFITNFGSTAIIFILLCVILVGLVKVVKNKRLAIFFLVCLIGNVFANQLIKAIIRRERPLNSLIYVGGFSFPSGHAMVSMSFYGFLIYVFYKLIKNERLRIFLIGLCVLLILLIGFSRIYLGVHYLSDVIVGFSLSLLYLDLFISILNKHKIFT